MGVVLSELVEALPLAPKGNFVSKVAPERELEEVLGLSLIHI